jgi:hypothetical protein
MTGKILKFYLKKFLLRNINATKTQFLSGTMTISISIVALSMTTILGITFVILSATFYTSKVSVPE